MRDILGPIICTAVALLAVYAVRTYERWRYLRFEQYADFPQLGKISFVWGHMKLLNEIFTSGGDPRRHIDGILLKAARDQGGPGVLLIDLRPLDFPLLAICSHEVAEQITKPTGRWSSSTPKSPTVSRDVGALTGLHSMLTAEGEHWRTQRRRLNPGFAPQHLLTTFPIILDKAKFFLAHLDQHATTGDNACLDELCANLTFDIIGAVTMARDLNAQIPGHQDELILTFFELLKASKGRPDRLFALINIKKKLTKRHLSNKLEKILNAIVVQEHENQISSRSKLEIGNNSTASRSVLALSLKDTTDLPRDLLLQISDNLRLFLFAGHDTTSVLIQWALYELARSPKQRAALVAELDAILGTDIDPEAIRAKLLAPNGAELISNVPYLSAVIRETLRLHPPAATVRFSPPGTGFNLTVPDTPGVGTKELCVDGMILYLNSYVVQRDREVWGETVDEFVPERWLGDTSWLPAGAWRPFERGPRSCIGQELANIEVKLVLALIVRRYEFTKVGIGEFDADVDGKYILDERGYYKTKSTLFNSTQITAKPVDGMAMKVKLSERAIKA